MASVSLTQWSVFWLNAGVEVTTHWNNAAYNVVYAFSVSPVAHQSGGVAKMEVTRVWQQHNYDTLETEVYVKVKNIGSVGGYCYINMSRVYS
jgi:hypothetical protein